jgi:DeoR/GlpR family transcriptional regulator of sugar metabolism
MVEDYTVATHRYAPQRQARLLEHLRSELFVDVQVLREKLGVSVATIRRDLTELEGRGLLKRTHGGAAVINQVTRDPANAVREITNAAEKGRIADAAAAMIVEGDAVMIDSGTTSLQVARRLASNKSLTFVTNGSDTLAALLAGGARNVHVIGGAFADINHSFSGPLAADMVRKFNVDKAVLSVSSIDLKRGLICTLSPEIGCVQAAMIDVAQTTLVVADHSKFQRTSLCVIAPLDQVDWIVTDDATRPLVASTPEKTRKKFLFACEETAWRAFESKGW